MIIRNLISIGFLLVALVSSGQGNFSKEYQFVQHLQNINSYNEGLFYIQKIWSSYKSLTQRDTLNYLKGKIYYDQHDLEHSIESFSGVSASSLDIYEQSIFYQSIQNAYLRKFDLTETLLKNTEFSTSLRNEVKVFELASNYLLKRELDDFDELSGDFTFNYYQLEDYERDMIHLSKNIRDHKTKSPFVAGLLSAVIPGTGRYYQGKIGQGTLGLASNAIFALQALEAYRKDGVKSPRFIIFSGAFAVFYISNIWGSAVSVRINEMRYNEDVDEAILINMHLPIRLLFD